MARYAVPVLSQLELGGKEERDRHLKSPSFTSLGMYKLVDVAFLFLGI